MAAYCGTLSTESPAELPSYPACPAVLPSGIGVAGQALGAYLLSTEMIGPSWRGVAGILTQVCTDCIVCDIHWQAICLGVMPDSTNCVQHLPCVNLHPVSISLVSQS